MPEGKSTNSSGLCQCGCGQATNINCYGVPRRYVSGHNPRTVNAALAAKGLIQCCACKRVLPVSDFAVSTAKRGRGCCRECDRAKSRAWHAIPANRDKNRGRKRAAALAGLGITQAEYDAMHAAQAGRCAICGRQEGKRSQIGRSTRLAVDHSHATGAVRSLLCAGCNAGLGMFRDDPALLRAAAEYLDKHAAWG